MNVQPINEKYRDAVNEILKREWDCPPEVSIIRILDTTKLPGFVCVEDETIQGVVTYHITNGECEIVTLNSFKENAGIGEDLINAVLGVAKAQGCGRLWLLTTNDNIHAIRYYQKRGFAWAGININAMDAAREIKPSIPLLGHHGIPIKHELVFEIKLV